MEQTQNISQEQDRADGNRAVPRRSFYRGQKATWQKAGCIILHANGKHRTAKIAPDFNVDNWRPFYERWVSWDELS
jgi:hypothetical protein